MMTGNILQIIMILKQAPKQLLFVIFILFEQKNIKKKLRKQVK